VVAQPYGRPREGALARRMVAVVAAVLDPARILGICVALVLWQLASLAIGPFTLPDPGTVVVYTLDNLFESKYLVSHGLSQGGGFVPHLLYSIRNVLSGVVAGTAIGVALGLLSLRIPIIAAVITPVAATFGTAPIVVAAPFFLIWFGIVPTAQFLMVSFYTALLLYIFSRRAGENVRPEYVESALTLGAGPWSIFRSVYIPGSIPEITAGFRIALAGSWGLEAVAELLGAQTGIGLLMRFYASAFVVEAMLSLTLLIGIIAVAFDLLAVLASRYVTRWSEAGHQLQL
jgi:ABC-type nitrate/sulfonate/bicarbonate transport system permease component